VGGTAFFATIFDLADMVIQKASREINSEDSYSYCIPVQFLQCFWLLGVEVPRADDSMHISVLLVVLVQPVSSPTYNKQYIFHPPSQKLRKWPENSKNSEKILLMLTEY
jgi:hypothetical protein